jgi:hypothetical protein
MSLTKSERFRALAVLVLMLVLVFMHSPHKLVLMGSLNCVRKHVGKTRVEKSLPRARWCRCGERNCYFCRNRRMSLTKSSLFRSQAMLDGCLERNRRFHRNRRMSLTKASLFHAQAVLMLVLMSMFMHLLLAVLNPCSIHGRAMSLTTSSLLHKLLVKPSAFLFSSHVLPGAQTVGCPQRHRYFAILKLSPTDVFNEIVFVADIVGCS